jgi:MFS family permease
VSPDEKETTPAVRILVIAWLVASTFYFYQYVVRSSPGVMMPQLEQAFGLSAAGVTAIVGLFYYGYAGFSLVAGIAMDQLGPRKVVPIGAACIGVGALLFAVGEPAAASLGRLLQGVGGAFSFVGAVYIAATYFPASRAATLIGATQMFGMAGGSAGQFLVGPIIARGFPWSQFWIALGFIGAILACLLLIFLPRTGRIAQADASRQNGLLKAGSAMWSVFRNRQSILCGLIAGLLFLPTTIFDMMWGVRFLQESHNVPYGMAVLQSASVPFGWIVGCPLLGLLSDRIGRRKPVVIGGAIVLLGCLALILYGPPGTFPPFSLGFVAGMASGAAMLPYIIIKEANAPEHGGTATGVINFINFSLSALLGPVFGMLLTRLSGEGPRELEHYQTAFTPLLFGVAIAIALTLLLRETGPAVRQQPNAPRKTKDMHLLTTSRPTTAP